jgi:DNA-binding transcriptional LysR family regulator
MHLTLRQLEVFAAVARHASFSRAADELHLTQPAVSMQIKQLEGNLGLPLFEQLGKKIFLTEAGREMYDCSRRVAQILNETDDVLQDMKGIKRGRLEISVATTANHFATRLLAGFSKRFDGLAVSLDVTNRQTLLQQLQKIERDLVIMGQPPDESDLVAEPFLENPLVVIAPPEHPLTQQKRISITRLSKDPFVVREPGSGTRGAAERFFAEAGEDFPMGMEMSSNGAIKHAVEAGLGLAVVSIHTVELELEARRLAILDVKGFPINRYWYLVQSKGKRLSPAAQAFRQFVLAEAETFVSLPDFPGAVGRKSRKPLGNNRARKI